MRQEEKMHSFMLLPDNLQDDLQRVLREFKEAVFESSAITTHI